ncbi:hypothetical protein WJW27_004859 [Escherichia coli]
MNEIELLSHKISTIATVLNNKNKVQSSLLRINKVGSSLYLEVKAGFAGQYNDKIREEVKGYEDAFMEVCAIVGSNPISVSPLMQNENSEFDSSFEGYLWYNAGDNYFIYQNSKTDYSEEGIKFIDPYNEAEVFQKSLIYNTNQMKYLMLFSTMHLNPLKDNLKFFIRLELVDIAYNLLIQGSSYEV